MSQDLEARLRAALAARADQVTPDSLRPAEPPRRQVRRARRWAAPLAVAAAALLVVMLAGLPRLLPDRDTDPNPGAGQDRTAVLDGAVLRIPAGWIYRPVAEGIGCVQPAGTPQPGGDCTPGGVEIRVGTFVGWPGNSIDSDDGWSLSHTCATATALAPRLAVTSNRLVERASPPVGGREAAYREWRVTCESGTSFSVRLWWLPDVAVTIYTMALDSRHGSTVDQLVASLDVTGVRPR
ncbi:hypothetical protein WEI85_08170 [Actinomycetes bacterium KLBMP 9797]